MKTSTWLLALSATAAASWLAAPVLADDDQAAADQDQKIKIEKKVRITGGDCPRMQIHGLSDAFVMNASKKGFLGVEITGLTPELRSHFGVPEGEGVMIGKIVDDSAAARAGLSVGDILTRVDGESIEGSWKLTSAIRNKGGETVDLEYWRDGSVTQTSVVLDEKESCSFDFSGYVDSIEELGERLPELQLRGLQISEDALEEVMESLRGINWEEHLESIQRIEIDELDVRMEGLQERLEELGERLEIEGIELGEEFEKVHVERIKVLEDRQRERIEREVRVRSELAKARAEARRAQAEHRLRAAEAREKARLHEHEARRTQAEAEAEARALLREAQRMAAEGEAGVVVIEEDVEVEEGGVI